MIWKNLFLSAVAYFSLGLLASSGQDDEPKPERKIDLLPFKKKVAALVAKYYPKANTTLEKVTVTPSLEFEVICFEHNTRIFMIHTPLLTGEWQDAGAVRGPQPGGIYGSICLKDGEWEGQAALPQAFDQRYFTTHQWAPYSKKLNRHLSVTLNYPKNVSKEFLKEFIQLIDGFEQHFEDK